jgi:SHS2 domain-containing protein
MPIYADDLAQLFARAAWAMFDQMSDATLIQLRQTMNVSVEGSAIEDLLVRWLSELLYLYDTQRFLYSAATFTMLGPTRLTASVLGEFLMPRAIPLIPTLRG